MKQLIWDMLGHQKNPGNTILVINDERTADALVRRGILKKDHRGYEIDESAAMAALAGKFPNGKKAVSR